MLAFFCISILFEPIASSYICLFNTYVYVFSASYKRPNLQSRKSYIIRWLTSFPSLSAMDRFDFAVFPLC